MELSEFARQVLTSHDLATKLAIPDGLNDQYPCSNVAIEEIKLPGRPPALAFGKGKRATFPKPQRFEDPRVRAAVLHYFANHELLALELMALALLKFPSAPRGFRLGIGQTMLEEIAHLHLYESRMQDLGLGFGELPVSQFFWNAMSQMQTPLDYTVQMSLTFEQANLDYSLHYQALFEEFEDFDSANIMRQVYEDEIGHVKHGAIWFERMRPCKASHWDEYAASLNPPLTPRRARGLGFDREGRIRAGIPEDSIDRLSVFNASKGRPGNLFWFNPDCEKKIASNGGPSSARMRAFTADYAPIMMFLGNEDDTLLLPRMPPLEFLKSWKDIGFSLPELKQLDEPDKAPQNLKGRRFVNCCPWGWEPSSALMESVQNLGIVQRLIPSLVNTSEQPDQLDMYQAFSKAHAARLRTRFLQENVENQSLANSTLDKVCLDFDSANSAISELQEQRYSVCVKGFFGSSGQNALRLFPHESLTENTEAWITRNCQRHGGVVVEPLYTRHLDFAVLIDTRKLNQPVRGVRRFFTSKRGQYKGHLLGDPLWGTSSDIKKFLHVDCQSKTLITKLSTFVVKELLRLGYEGPAGIDCFIAEDLFDPKRFCLRPLVEINPRYTMGHVALGLEKPLRPKGDPALWWHVSKSELKLFGTESFLHFWDFLQQKLQRPPLATNPVPQASSCLGFVVQGKRDCQFWLENLQNFIK